MKGYRSVILHVVMGLSGISGVLFAPDHVQLWGPILISLWSTLGIMVRAFTTTPIFSKLPPEAQVVASEIVALTDKGKAPLAADPPPAGADAPANGGATITGPPDLVALATGVTTFLQTAQAEYDRIAQQLQAAHATIGAAMPRGVVTAVAAAPQPQPAAQAAGGANA